MKKFFALADQYIQESDWRMLAALKFCLFSMGVLVGKLPDRQGKGPGPYPLRAGLLGDLYPADDQVFPHRRPQLERWPGLICGKIRRA